MVNLTKASRELFSRTPDERFGSFDTLAGSLPGAEENGRPSIGRFRRTFASSKRPIGLRMRLEDAEEANLSLSDWSFTPALQVVRRPKGHRQQTYFRDGVACLSRHAAPFPEAVAGVRRSRHRLGGA